MAPLIDVASIERTSVGPADIEPDAAYVGLENVASDGRFVDVSAARAAKVKSTKFRFSDRHVLYGKLRPYLAKIAAPDFGGVCSTDILPIAPAPDMDRRFLLHYLRTPAMVEHASRLATGANLPRLSPKTLATFDVPVPPIDEQRRIAAVLDAADELLAKRREALAKLDTLTQAIFIDMFGRSDHAFELAPIGDLVAPGKNNIRTGPFGSQLLHEEFTEEGIAVLGIDNAVSNRFVWGKRRFISAEKYEQLRRFTVRPGDVLVTIMATTGRVAVVPDGIPTAINTKHLCCITLDQSKCLPWYLWAALRFDPSVRRQLGATHGAVMPGLNMGKIKQAELPLPPLHLQEQFVQRLNAVERQSSMSAASQDELSLLFASLQQRAFRGEL
ncbi:restriction endonuclease subunit S [Nitriliruptoraceae bacterium ZYF776]|nr:restriction endonuclease subunit S [Profundirhabdus halotolerans]